MPGYLLNLLYWIRVCLGIRYDVLERNMQFNPISCMPGYQVRCVGEEHAKLKSERKTGRLVIHHDSPCSVHRTVCGDRDPVWVCAFSPRVVSFGPAVLALGPCLSVCLFPLRGVLWSSSTCVGTLRARIILASWYIHIFIYSVCSGKAFCVFALGAAVRLPLSCSRYVVRRQHVLYCLAWLSFIDCDSIHRCMRLDRPAVAGLLASPRHTHRHARWLHYRQSRRAQRLERPTGLSRVLLCFSDNRVLSHHTPSNPPPPCAVPTVPLFFYLFHTRTRSNHNMQHLRLYPTSVIISTLIHAPCATPGCLCLPQVAAAREAQTPAWVIRLLQEPGFLSRVLSLRGAIMPHAPPCCA